MPAIDNLQERLNCIHKWEVEECGDCLSDLRTERRWCEKCGEHQKRREEVAWGRWEELPPLNIGSRKA